MRVKRRRNIDSLLAREYSKRGDPWIVEDRGKHGNLMSYGGDQYNTEGEEGRNFLSAVDRYYSGDDWTKDLGEEAKKRLMRGKAASMADFGDEEGGGFYNEAMGLLDSDSIGTPTDPYMSSENLKGENRYLNKLAREEFAEKQMDRYDDDLGFSVNKPKDISKFYESGATWASEGESELDRVGREFMKKKIMEDNKYDDLDPQDKRDVESSFGERIEQGRVGDAFSGLFSSDSGRDESLAKEKKDNEALSGKIAAGAKLYSLLKPETQQAAPSIPAAKISRGSVAFPGMKLASQKARRKYFTPKGLMA